MPTTWLRTSRIRVQLGHNVFARLPLSRVRLRLGFGMLVHWLGSHFPVVEQQAITHPRVNDRHPERDSESVNNPRITYIVLAYAAF